MKQQYDIEEWGNQEIIVRGGILEENKL